LSIDPVAAFLKSEKHYGGGQQALKQEKLGEIHRKLNLRVSLGLLCNRNRDICARLFSNSPWGLSPSV